MQSDSHDINKKQWGHTLLLTIIMVLSVLFSLELYLRHQGYSPSITDDRDLWSIERNKVTGSPKEVVFIGSSRSRTDVAIDTFERLAAGYKVIQLSVDSSCANEALMDLSEQTEFNGIVITEITEECVLFGNEPDLSVASLVKYRKKEFKLNDFVNKGISIFLQKHFIVMDPYFSFYKIMADIILHKELRMPRYWTTHVNRSQDMDYSKLDIEDYSRKRVKHVEMRMKSFKPSISFDQFQRNFSFLEASVNKIQERGGQVVFAFFPMGEKRWEINEKYFPKKKYWNFINENSKAIVIHYKDFPSLSLYKPPDESHLDFRDKKYFTEDLFQILVNKNII